MATDFSSKDTAEKYSEGVIAEELSLRPVILEVTGNIQGKKILDLGCGDGRYSIVFARNSAHVIAIDASEHQFNIAKDINSHENITYLLGDVASIPSVEDNSVDLVFANMLIPDLESKEKYEDFVREASRTLKEYGRLIVSILHPLYISADQDSSDRPLDFKKENYFFEGHSYRANAITKKGNSVHFNETHFSLTYISDVLYRNHFKIRRLVESRTVPEKEIFLPKYLVIECVK